MITRIESLRNVGRFRDFSFNSEATDFSKYNLILGYNGSGKTTLSNIFRLFSSQEANAEALFKDITNRRTDAVATLVIGGRKISFRPGCETRRVYVFNPDFVADHVYRGDKFAVKRFDSAVITEDQLKNPTIASLESSLKDRKRKIEQITTNRKKLENDFDRIKRSYSKEFNEKVKGSRSQSLAIPLTAPEQTLEEAKRRLSEAYAKHELSTKQEELKSDIATLEAKAIGEAEIDVHLFKDIMSKSVDSEARKKIAERLKRFEGYSPHHCMSLDEWYEDGFGLLSHGNSLKEKKCPLCDSNIEATIVDLLKDYASYFSKEYADINADLSRIANSVESDFGLLAKNTENLDVITFLEKKYRTVVEAPAESIKWDIQSVQNCLKAVKSAVDEKRSNLVREVTAGPTTDLCQSVTIYNEITRSIEQRRIDLLEALNGISINEAAAVERIRSAISACVFAEFNESDSGMQVARFQTLGKELSVLETEVRENVNDLASEIAKIRNESKYTNQYLARLGIRHFQIVLEGDAETDNIRIQFDSGDSRTELRHSLSESEKTALAFSYFLSKVRYEVIENTAASLSETVLVVDDPVSSLDDNRLHATAALIMSELKDAKQLFVLSHNIPFMKFMSNLVGTKTIPSGDEHVSVRRDYYLSDSREQIVPLPESLRNYTSTYYQKLNLIAQFVQGEISYEEAKAYLPMYVRTVLETFLSFKLCVLSQGRGGQIAGLDKLSHSVQGCLGLFENFEPVREVDCSSVVGDIEDIKRITDPFVHGSPHDLAEVAFISERELKEVATRTLDVVCFLDRIHFDFASRFTKP